MGDVSPPCAREVVGGGGGGGGGVGDVSSPSRVCARVVVVWATYHLRARGRW